MRWGALPSSANQKSYADKVPVRLPELQPNHKGGKTMQVRETRLGNFAIIQLFESEKSGVGNLLDIRLEPNFNKVRIAAAHAMADTQAKRAVVYLTPPKRFNKNSYVVVLGTEGKVGVCLKFTITSDGIYADPAKVLLPAQSVADAYAQLLMAHISEGTRVFGVPQGSTLPTLLAVYLRVGERQIKFLVAVAEQDVATNPAPFKELLAAVKRPPLVRRSLPAGGSDGKGGKGKLLRMPFKRK